MRWLTDFIRPKIRALTKRETSSETLWTKCTGCDHMIFQKDLEKSLWVCPQCQTHMAWPWRQRLESLFDDRYTVLDTPVVAQDPLGFKDHKKYTERLKVARSKTQEKEAVHVACGSVMSHPVVAAVFDFQFIGGSMGMAAGESLLAAAQQAVERRAALLFLPSSGGARMQEGMLSLMQMPRSIIALQMVREQCLPTITAMVHPTTGGVLASFASLSDIILAEPGALIGFTGARVIQETSRQVLPQGFQSAEFQKEHGFVDLITPRTEMRAVLGNILAVLQKKPYSLM